MKRYPDPVARYEKFLVENQVATADELAAITKEVRKTIRNLAESVYQECQTPGNKPTVADIVKLNVMWATPMEGLV